MIHPSYNELINAVNNEVEPGEHPVIQSRYSIVIATAKRARQLVSGAVSLSEALYREDTVVIKTRETLDRVFVRKPILVEDHF